MKRSEFPQGWDEERVLAVIRHYDQQTEDEAVAEYEAALAERKAGDAESPGPPSKRFAEYETEGHPASVVSEKIEDYKGEE